jgi:hypothetical protein
VYRFDGLECGDEWRFCWQEVEVERGFCFGESFCVRWRG